MYVNLGGTYLVSKNVEQVKTGTLVLISSYLQHLVLDR